MLFDLNLDPSEKRNVAEDFPSILHTLNKVAVEHISSFIPPESELEKVDTMLINGTKAYDY